MTYVADADQQELLALLQAYELMMRLCWPSVHKTMDQRKSTWAALDALQLKQELHALMFEADSAPSPLRVFWKRLPNYDFWGGSLCFARDAGFKEVAQLFGKTDFSKELPWNRQAALYRKDDEEVVNTLREKLNIVQRQDQTNDTIYLHAAKVPIRSNRGTCIGLMGGYTLIDTATAARMMHTPS